MQRIDAGMNIGNISLASEPRRQQGYRQPIFLFSTKCTWKIFCLRIPSLRIPQGKFSPRTQRVVVDGAMSQEARVLSGVPQGTVLAGPCCS